MEKAKDDIIAEIMKIALFTDTYLPDLNGVSISVGNIAQTLRAKGHKVYIFGPKIKGHVDRDKDVYRLSSLKIMPHAEPNIYTPTLLPNKEFREMLSMDFDLIHAHGNGPYSMLGYLVGKIKRLPFLMTFHTMHTEYTHYFLDGKLVTPKMVTVALKAVASICDIILTPSDKMKNELLKYGVTKPIYVTPNFLEQKRFTNYKKNFLREFLGLKEDDIILFTASRIGKEKNLDLIIKAFAKVYINNKKAHLVIAGQGPYRENIERLSKAIGVNDRVHFTGLILYDVIPSAYFDSDIFVFASHTETQGIVILEAITAGVPIVAVKDEAFANMVVNGINGYLVDDDPDDFAEKIITLLKNKKLRTDFSKESLKLASEFDASKSTDRLISIYKEALKGEKN